MIERDTPSFYMVDNVHWTSRLGATVSTYWSVLLSYRRRLGENINFEKQQVAVSVGNQPGPVCAKGVQILTLSKDD